MNDTPAPPSPNLPSPDLLPPDPLPTAPASSAPIPVRPAPVALRFDRNEWAGAFGDLGTDLPLVVAVTLVAGLDGASVFILFGLMQILTGLRYRMPMPVQPLKAMAAIVIGAKGAVTGGVLLGAGLVIGIVMLALTATGLIGWLARVVPKVVVRGIQLGLGIQLATLALKDFVQSDGVPGLWLAFACFVVTVALLGHRRYPAALIVVAMGVAYALVLRVSPRELAAAVELGAPKFHAVSLEEMRAGFWLLAIPQIALSLGNSILATRQISTDLFPDRAPTIRQLGFTYSLMNLVSPFFGGIPVCHGSGGMVGHHAFGGRTGGSVVIEGAIYVLIGALFGAGFETTAALFPKPMLGVILFFEGIALILLVRDVADRREDFAIAAMVAIMAVGLPNGFLIGMISGVVLAALMKRGWATLGPRG